MKKERLQLRIDSKLKKAAWRAARLRRTTLSSLITEMLHRLVDGDEVREMARAAIRTKEVEQV